jgi:hypothetical protein
MSREKIEEMANCKECSHIEVCVLAKPGGWSTCPFYKKETDVVPKSEWISVEERLPDVLDDYLVTIKLKYAWETEWEYDVDVASLVVEGGYIDGIWDTLHDWIEGQECHVTHWMPLPEPPKMRKEDDGV